jgi:hypothetical protein
MLQNGTALHAPRPTLLGSRKNSKPLYDAACEASHISDSRFVGRFFILGNIFLWPLCIQFTLNKKIYYVKRENEYANIN